MPYRGTLYRVCQKSFSQVQRMATEMFRYNVLLNCDTRHFTSHYQNLGKIVLTYSVHCDIVASFSGLPREPC